MTLKKAINDYYNISFQRWGIEQKRVHIILLFLNFDYTLERIGAIAGANHTQVSKVITDRNKYKIQVDAIQNSLHSIETE
jgi:hypothetical protein